MALAHSAATVHWVTVDGGAINRAIGAARLAEGACPRRWPGKAGSPEELFEHDRNAVGGVGRRDLVG